MSPIGAIRPSCRAKTAVRLSQRHILVNLSWKQFRQIGDCPMPRNAILLSAALVVTGGVASAEETASARMFRYAILINQQEPIYGEAACADYPCQLVDHRAPDVTLSLSSDDGGLVRPIVSCGVGNCFVSNRSENIDLRQSGKVL